MKKLFKGYSKSLETWVFGIPIDENAILNIDTLKKEDVDPKSINRNSEWKDLFENDIVVDSDGAYGFLQYSRIEFCWFVSYPDEINNHPPYRMFRRTLDASTTRNIRYVANKFECPNFNFTTGNQNG